MKERPYEFTMKDWDNLWGNNNAIRQGMPCDCSEESLKELTKFTQTKLVKYLHNNHLLEHNVANFMNGKCDDTCESCRLILEFVEIK